MDFASANNKIASSAGIVTPSTSASSSPSFEANRDYALHSESQNNGEPWGLGIVLSNQRNADAGQNAGMAGLVTTHSPRYTTPTRSGPPSSLPATRPSKKRTNGNSKRSAATTGASGTAASFFQKLAASFTSFMSTTSDNDDRRHARPKSQIEDMLESYYISQGREVPGWVRSPPPDPQIDTETRQSILLTNPHNASATNISQQSMDPSRESSSKPGSSKSVFRSFARLNISKFTRQPFLGLHSPSAGTSDVQHFGNEDANGSTKNRAREKSHTPRLKYRRQMKQNTTGSDPNLRTSQTPGASSTPPVHVQLVESSDESLAEDNDSGFGSPLDIPSPIPGLQHSSESRLVESNNAGSGADVGSPDPMEMQSPKRYPTVSRIFGRDGRKQDNGSETPSASPSLNNHMQITAGFPTTRIQDRSQKITPKSPWLQYFSTGGKKSVHSSQAEPKETNPFDLLEQSSPKTPSLPQSEPEQIDSTQETQTKSMPLYPAWLKPTRAMHFLSPRRSKRGEAGETQTVSPTLETPSANVDLSDDWIQEEGQSRDEYLENKETEARPRVNKVMKLFKRKSVHM
ncbi:hypothetical protein GGI26_002843 [Coemansia sp. RSA 1358]|nr:hypothetical protein EDC05_002438 [Coemansia umbellata]KAJ2622877.1 hypothetical protein GGI26_002843 [Coemansia sp. RSA 1358]